MNERMQELITAYLHRGSTPEQEKELFEACKNDPATAEHLRQHLILSLKLRGLRDDVVVSSDVRSSLERRIEALAPETAADEPSVAAIPVHDRRFRLAHLFGTGLATAAAAIVVTLLLRPVSDGDTPPVTAQVTNVADTVYVVERDTIRHIREVERKVFIVKNEIPDSMDESPNPISDEAQIAERTDVPKKIAPAPIEDQSPIETEIANNEPLFADARPVEPVTVETKTKNYIEQYNAMLVSVESVQLSSKDRVSF